MTRIQGIATNEQADPINVTSMLHQIFLALDIMRAILNDTQPKRFDWKFLTQPCTTDIGMISANYWGFNHQNN
jgi:hypothetical protein